MYGPGSSKKMESGGEEEAAFPNMHKKMGKKRGVVTHPQ